MEERIQALDKLGFVWNWEEDDSVSFMEFLFKPIDPNADTRQEYIIASNNDDSVSLETFPSACRGIKGLSHAEMSRERLQQECISRNLPFNNAVQLKWMLEMYDYMERIDHNNKFNYESKLR